MRRPARIATVVLFVTLAAHPGRADIIVNWLDTPIDLSTDSSTWYQPLDMNGDSIVDFTFGIDITAVHVRGEDNNQYLIFPSSPPNIGGYVAPVPDGFEIGSNSGDGELDWFSSDSFAPIIIGLSGPDGYVLLGEFVGQRAYIGVALDIAGETHYGWIDMYVSDLGPGALVYGWAYESNPNTSIIAGVVPEPSTMILVVTGSLALLYSGARKRNR